MLSEKYGTESGLCQTTSTTSKIKGLAERRLAPYFFMCNKINRYHSGELCITGEKWFASGESKIFRISGN
jgi:hypothetical protein